MKIIKRIATIKKWKNVSIELNLIDWGDGKPKYDLRKWENETPLKGVSMDRDSLEALYRAVSKELDHESEQSSDNNDIDIEELPFNDNIEYETDLPFDIHTSDNEEQEYQAVLDYHNVVVHDNIDECIHSGHDYVKVSATVPVYTNSGVQELTIPAFHCKTCKAYYISSLSYNSLISHGSILCRVVNKKEYNLFIKNKDFRDLYTQSILNIIGYTVNSKDDLSDACRQTILTRAINAGVFSKKKAINHLSFLIKLNADKDNFMDAVAKWKRDRDFLLGKKAAVDAIKVTGIIKE